MSLSDAPHPVFVHSKVAAYWCRETGLSSDELTYNEQPVFQDDGLPADGVFNGPPRRTWASRIRWQLMAIVRMAGCDYGRTQRVWTQDEIDWLNRKIRPVVEATHMVKSFEVVAVWPGEIQYKLVFAWLPAEPKKYDFGGVRDYAQG